MDVGRNWFTHLQLGISKCTLFSVKQALNLGRIKTTNLAEIAATWLTSVSMVVTPELLISLRSATGPPEALWPVVVQLLLVGAKFILEFISQIVGFGIHAIAPSHVFSISCGFPGDQFKLSFVGVAVLASAVTVVPVTRRARTGRGWHP